MAIPICVFTAFSEVPKNALIRRCCLIHLKKSSTCQRQRYQIGDAQSGQSELVGQEYEPLVGLRIDVLDAT
jgi:hypothetical protein